MGYSPCFFPKNGQKITPTFITFSKHIDVLMLCSKFELISTSIFQVMDILKKRPISEKITVL